MNSEFSTILIPVDFTINTEVAVKRALSFAVPGTTTIHLLHVDSAPGSLSRVRRLLDPEHHSDLPSPEKKIAQWKTTIEETRPDINVCCWISRGDDVQRAIIAKIKKLLPDLIIIGKRSNHTWLPFLKTVNPTTLINQNGAAVLTVKPGSLHHNIRTIVVPVAEHVPHQKMEVISMLGRKMKLKIHLVSFVKGDEIPPDFSAGPLLQMYQWLKNVQNCPVEYAVLHGSSKSKAFLAYAEKIGADMLLLQPEAETKTGWPGRDISDLLPPDSRTQLMAVS